MMQQYVDSGRQAVRDKNWLAALVLGLTLPDMCGRIDDTQRKDDRLRYTRWCKKWIVPQFQGVISPDDIYSFRCKMLHEGVSDLDSRKKPKAERFLFVAGGGHIGHVHNNETVKVGVSTIHRSAYVLDPAPFCETIFSGVEAWLVDVANDGTKQEALSKLLSVSANLNIGGISIRSAPGPLEKAFDKMSTS
jgi:hypothetical protein